ncbi:MAG: formate dehydrogenase accessory sulfurtransferase FdhD [Candidatus Freyrarchaeum guaymaensis]
MEKTVSVKITRLKDGRASETVDRVVRENILIIRVNGRQVVGVVYLPGEEKELVFGHLYTTGVIESVNEVENYTFSNHTANLTLREGIDVDDRLATCVTGQRLVTSACGPPEFFVQLKQGVGLPRVESELRVESGVILSATRTMGEKSTVFRETGGTHAAALFSGEGRLLYFSEDVGRHNAVDKVIGAALLSGNSFGNSFLVSTGRQTVDMVVKAARAGVPLVASLSAATESGISAAESTNVTLIGFARGRRMNIYTHPHRVL